ncbi:MAG: RNA pseudouridine synthase, partial [Cyclobacteriaceae bacterium]|nr:RNA pseudouridine synthase [Cyclobacteriaceae bacterium]
PVTGVVIFARTSKALERMNELFRNRDTQKTYWALVAKKPSSPQGTLIHWLIKDEKKNKTTAYLKENSSGQRSELSYRLVEQKAAFFLLEIKPITGRPHQIRVQLATLGCPIVGDVKYGYPTPNPDGSICLHARQLQFVHPVKKEPFTVTANLPKNQFWKPFFDSVLYQNV